MTGSPVFLLLRTWPRQCLLLIIATTWDLSGAAAFLTPIGGSDDKCFSTPHALRSSRGRGCFRKTSDGANFVVHSDQSTGQEVGDRSKGVGFYVHIPYCRKRCRYCDFAIVPIGPLNSSLGDIENESLGSRQSAGFLRMDSSYRDAVLAEIELIRASTDRGIPLRSIYFGGGTPSLAPLSTIRSILESILLSSESPFYVPDGDEIEITMEMDPGTFDLNKLQSLKGMGFNRISLGVQSFDNDLLEAIGRVHRNSDIKASIAMIRDVFDDANYSVDLISGLPGLTLAKWAETLVLATTLDPPPAHLSLYDLQIEQGTVFGRWYDIENEEENSSPMLDPVPSLSSGSSTNTAVSTLPLPTSYDSAFMYKYASGYLRSKGYEHYEISSYAGTKRSCHNQIYWEVESEWYGKTLCFVC